MKGGREGGGGSGEGEGGGGGRVGRSMSMHRQVSIKKNKLTTVLSVTSIWHWSTASGAVQWVGCSSRPINLK